MKTAVGPGSQLELFPDSDSTGQGEKGLAQFLLCRYARGREARRLEFSQKAFIANRNQ